MGKYTHLLLAQFKEGAAVEDIVDQMVKLASEIDAIESFEWGVDDMNLPIYRKAFTHAFVMTFNSKEDLLAFRAHKKHLEFAVNFEAAVKVGLIFDFPAVIVKVSPPVHVADPDADASS